MIPDLAITTDAYQPDLAPLGGSLVGSALIALIPVSYTHLTLPTSDLV